MKSIYSRKEFANTPKFQKWQEVQIRLRHCQICGRKVAVAKEKKHMTKEAIKMLKSGSTAKELAEKFDYSAGFFLRLKRSLGLSKKEQTQKKEKEIEQLFKKGKSGAEIKRMGYGYKLIRRVKDSLLGDFKTRMAFKEETVRKLILSRITIKEICEQSGSCQSYVIKVKKKMSKEGLAVKLNKRRKKDG